MDEDRYTSVTVEAVNVTREGLHNVVNEVEQEKEEKTVLDVGGLISSISSKGLNNENARPGKQAWTKDRPDGMKKKKRKFRYESKAERKVTRHKERLGNQSKAKARKK